MPLRFDIATTNSFEAARLVAEGQVDVAVVSSDRAPAAGDLPLFRQPFAWVAPARLFIGPLKTHEMVPVPETRVLPRGPEKMKTRFSGESHSTPGWTSCIR